MTRDRSKKSAGPNPREAPRDFVSIRPERRGSPRVPWELPVTVEIDDRQVAGSIHDVSATGLFISGLELEKGTHVELRIVLPGALEHGRGNGRVVHHDRKLQGVGVALSWLDDSTLDAIIDRLADATLGDEGG